MLTVTISGRAARSLRGGHPWVFSNEIRSVEGVPSPGDVVRVAAEGRAEGDLGTAFFNPHSLIALRHLSFEGEEPTRDLLARRLLAARGLRERLHPDSDTWRLCHGESDFLPGLVVDRHADVFVVQASSAGADRLLAEVASILEDEHGARSVVERNESPQRALEGLPPRTGVLRGADPGTVVVTLPPLRIPVDPLRGQKTGSFLDQRENRSAAARHARGRKVYEAHCNLGILSLLAAAAGAASVVGVDSSEEAVEGARAAAALNGLAVEFVAGDASKDMDQRHRRHERFGLVALDPPSFTRSRKHVPQARRAYRELNRRAMTLVEPGGVLVTSSCSHHVTEATFLDVLLQASLEAQRTLRLIEIRSQAPDHPVLLAFPESRYLKCVIAQVL